MSFVLVLTFLGVALFHGYYYACALQLKNYRNREVFSVIKRSVIIDTFSFVLAATLTAVAFFIPEDYVNAHAFAVLTPSLIGVVVKALCFKGAKVTFTRRMKTIAAVYTVILLAIGIVCVIFLPCLLGAVASMTLPIVLLANGSTLLFFKNKNKKYLDACRAKLKKDSPLIVAVTGSGGKTSVKNMLSTFLEEKGKTYATPKSYNTPLGISSAVSTMDDDVEIFVAEFGARKTGDVKELVDLVKPQIGVLTSIAAQHLETFGSIENVAKEKISLLESTQTSYASAVVENVLPAATTKVKKEDIRINRLDIYGTAFTYEYKGEVYEVETQLLGLNNVYNLTLAITVAYDLGVSAEKIREKIPYIKATPHRLEGIDSEGVRIIDDGYNVNPSGAEDAVRLLSTYKGRKIVTTSGFVEVASDEENEKFARFLAKTVDVVIVLGSKNKRALVAGLAGTVYYCVNDLNECKKLYADILKKGDALLITANLPESYCM